MSQSTVKKIPNNYFDGMPVTGFHKIVFFIIMMAYFCEQMDNWNFGFIAPALMHTWGLQMSDIGVVTLWYFIGMTAGGFFGGVISDFIGRRKTFLISIATFSFFSALNGFTDNFHVFVIARSMTGFGVFCLMVCSQAYIAEMAPASRRGGLVAWNQFAIIFGMLVVYFVNYFIALNGDEAWLTSTGWRLMFLSEVIPAALLFLLVLGVPESPRWLIMKGREAKAVAILERINGAPEAEVEAQSIRRSLHGTVKAKLFSYGVGVIVIGMLLSVFQQFIGINVVLYYAPEIFRNMGMGTNAALAQTIIVGVINLSFTVLAIFTVDRFGRHPLMIIGSLGMAVSMVTLGMTFFLEQMGFLSLLAMLCYVASFAVSWGPICWVLLAEIFPNKIRSQAMALAVAAQWVANYVVSWTFPMMDKSSYLIEHFHHGFAYWIYALMGLASAFFMVKFVPETKGKSLEEMEKLFKK